MNRPSVYERVENGISQLLQGEIDAGQLAGASIAILHKGEEIFRKEYGFADISERKPVDEGTIFRLYSMSKPVAAVAAMILMERGQIDLYAPISQYLPAAKDMKVSTDQGLVEARSDILVLDLLRMTSGIVYPDADAPGICMQTLFDEIQDRLEGGEQISTLDLCNRVLAQPLAFHPGDRWRYGFSTDIMGVIIEVVSGMKLGEFYEKELFGPLGMVDTGFYVPQGKWDRLAQLYVYDEAAGGLAVEEKRHLCMTKCLSAPSFESAGAGLVSTLKDYTRFARMLAAGGTYGGVRILGRKSMALLGLNQLTPSQEKTVYFDSVYGYGYGNFMRIYQDAVKAGSCGSVGEFGWDGWTGTYMTVNPQEEFAIVMMLQRCGYTNNTLLRKLRNMAYALI